MYRDRNATTEERIAVLEEQLERQAAELETLREVVSEKDTALSALISATEAKLERRTARWRMAALIAAAVTLVLILYVLANAAGTVSEVSVAPSASSAPADELLLADPAPDPPGPFEQLAVGPNECDPNDPMCQRRSAEVAAPPPGTADPRFDEKRQKLMLYDKAAAGRASEAELRMLKAICMNDGDRACRNMATRLLRDRRPPRTP